MAQNPEFKITITKLENAPKTTTYTSGTLSTAGGTSFFIQIPIRCNGVMRSTLIDPLKA